MEPSLSLSFMYTLLLPTGLKSLRSFKVLHVTGLRINGVTEPLHKGHWRLQLCQMLNVLCHLICVCFGMFVDYLYENIAVREHV